MDEQEKRLTALSFAQSVCIHTKGDMIKVARQVYMFLDYNDPVLDQSNAPDNVHYLEHTEKGCPNE